MFENRISELFQPVVVQGAPQSTQANALAAAMLPMASMENIYQAAWARARYDYELDKLFNPDYYGDNGSGI